MAAADDTDVLHRLDEAVRRALEVPVTTVAGGPDGAALAVRRPVVADAPLPGICGARGEGQDRWRGRSAEENPLRALWTVATKDRADPSSCRAWSGSLGVVAV